MGQCFQGFSSYLLIIFLPTLKCAIQTGINKIAILVYFRKEEKRYEMIKNMDKNMKREYIIDTQLLDLVVALDL